MKNRINQLFETKKENILSVYFTAGFPRLNDTVEIIHGLQKCGTNLIVFSFDEGDESSYWHASRYLTETLSELNPPKLNH